MNGNVYKKPYNQYAHVSRHSQSFELKYLLVINDLFMNKNYTRSCEASKYFKYIDSVNGVTRNNGIMAWFFLKLI